MGLDAVLDEGVTGKGMANSRAAALRFTGDFVGDLGGDNGGTKGSAGRPLGDADARVRVSDEAFVAVVSWGRSARGISGTVFTLL